MLLYNSLAHGQPPRKFRSYNCFANNKSGKSKDFKPKSKPHSAHMLFLLLRNSMIALLVLVVLIWVHGDSPARVFLAQVNSKSSDYSDGLEDYPSFHVKDSNNQDKEEQSEQSEEILSSPDELLISLKEQKLANEVQAERNDELEEENLSPYIEEQDLEEPEEGLIEELGALKFSDARSYLNAPVVHVKAPASMAQGLWRLQKVHDEFFSSVIHRQFIPHLAEPITKLQFHQVFRQTSTPVIIPFSTLRVHGFLTKAFTLSELRARFPYTPPANGKLPLAYTSSSGKRDGLDLGPALYVLSQDLDLEKKKGHRRSYPRNLMLKSKYLNMLDISHPPFVPKKRFQPPTLWFGTSTADTRLHSDCCDNFVQMVSGTKRWYIAPPTDSHNLGPIKCDGANQALCWAGVKFPSGPRSREMTDHEKQKLGMGNGFVIDLHAGEMLYLPAGWWHHVENLGPTIMVNFWTFGCENVALALDLDPQRSDRNDFKKCPAVAQADAAFIYS